MAMGHNLWLHFEVDEHPFATYFDVHQVYRVLTHSHMPRADFMNTLGNQTGSPQMGKKTIEQTDSLGAIQGLCEIPENDQKNP